MLTIENLRTQYLQNGRPVEAVRGVSLTVPAATSVALVGESGSGKSTVAMSAMNLVRPPIGRIVGGSVRIGDVEISAAGPRRTREILRRSIGFIPQDPVTALDPLFTVRSQIREALPDEDRERGDQVVVELLSSLGITDAEHRLGARPHQFSGGMRQRVAIAIALAKRPQVLIADEPTTALDVTTQVGILRILDGLRRDRGLSTLFITHNMRVARLLCQEAVVMYGGLVVESGPMAAVMERPSHPYTRALVEANSLGDRPRTALRAIPGNPPSLSAMPAGCPFAPRCDQVVSACHSQVPDQRTSAAGTRFACWNPVAS